MGAAIASADKLTLYNYSADNKSVISVCVISLELDAAGKVSGAGFDDRVAAGREQFTLRGGVEPKASMISMSSTPLLALRAWATIATACGQTASTATSTASLASGSRHRMIHTSSCGVGGTVAYSPVTRR